jgi:uncharacterized protein YbbC (DUF1343 family)
MVSTGLDQIISHFPEKLAGKKIGVLCHASSISSDFKHITNFLHERHDCSLGAIFGPQHGPYGQTQDNMITWQGGIHPSFGVPVYSLYSDHRKPTIEMLAGLEAFIVDLQDVGARLYTYIWTVKLCMLACSEAGIPVWILDRPNPIARVPFDGPVLKDEYFTFVGGASIPMCHRMTIGEMAVWIRDRYIPRCDLTVIWMKGWKRDSLYSETGLPWVLPSPNMPTLQTALVYPGTVLIEALNLSEGRGTTIPFELLGAPFINPEKLLKNLEIRKPLGCRFRIHGFIPAFNKFTGIYCNGIQVHVTDPSSYHPVETAYEIFQAVIETTPEGSMKFKDPPYEYEYKLMPFDILSGDNLMRESLLKGAPLAYEKQRWEHEIGEFRKEFIQIAAYRE